MATRMVKFKEFFVLKKLARFKALLYLKPLLAVSYITKYWFDPFLLWLFQRRQIFGIYIFSYKKSVKSKSMTFTFDLGSFEFKEVKYD